MKVNLENIFVTEGVPEYTFVEPPNFGDILLDIRKIGKPVIIEGQSGTGKTTTVKTVIQKLRVDADIAYLTARKPDDVERVRQMIARPKEGYFVVDDFHRLPEDLRMELAEIAKLAAELGSEGKLPKLIVIGINQVGADLIQLVGDIAKRTGIHRIAPGRKTEIDNLIASGCEKLRIQIEGSDRIFEESRGDYWLTQQICQTICSLAGVTESLEDKRPIGFDIAQVRTRMVGKLEAAYYPAVKEFCRGRRFRPSNDPYFKLLRELGQQENSVVDLNELANANEGVRGSINNIKERRLSVLIDSSDLVGRYFYYNRETKNFAIEDPALFYFLRHLDWNKLRADCGFRERDNPREYEVAISFAGENRDLARYISDRLVELDVHVFFDELYEDNFLGRAWSAEFKRIFADQSELVVCLLDKHHLEKIWPTFERDCFRHRVKNAEVIPIHLDGTIFPGISSDIAGIHFNWDASDPSWDKRVDEEIVLRLIDRIA
ncbi:MAG: TIR domain-containing protein [Hyphomicrobiales bacterium]